MTMDLADRLLDELRPGLAPGVLAQLGPVAETLAQAGHIACYGVGREGLMMKALAMRALPPWPQRPCGR